MNIRDWEVAEIKALKILLKKLLVENVRSTIDGSVNKVIDQMKKAEFDLDSNLNIRFTTTTTGRTLLLIHRVFKANNGQRL